jgi:nicotinamide mononucleotide transporter
MEIFWQQLRAMSLVEWGGVVTTLLCVVLLIKNNIMTWPIGITSVLLYGWVFYQSSLYANMWLQLLYYLPMQIIGWYWWLRGGPKKQDDLPITRCGPLALSGWLLASLPLAAFWGYLIHRSASQTPLLIVSLDAWTTAASVIGQYLMTRKYIENWIVWFLADVIYTFLLFPMQKLYPTTLLYFILTLMAVQGYRDWLRLMRQQEVVPVAA